MSLFRKNLVICLVFVFMLGFLSHGNTSVDELTEKLLQANKVSERINLCRLKGPDNLLSQYTNQVDLASKGQLNLNIKLCADRTKMVARLASSDGYKNHMFVSSIRIDEGSHTFRPFLRAPLFNGIIHSSPNQNLVIDWASSGSTIKPHKECHKHLSQISHGKRNDGHSEPQLIADIEALFIKDHTQVVKLFTPAEDSSALLACGLEFYSSFDACNLCLDDLIEFRKSHQKGQRSISCAIRDSLKDRFKGKKEDAFVLLYHAHYPYKDATYHGEDEKSYWGNFQYSYRPSPRVDTFLNRAFEDTHTLVPHHHSVPLRKDIMLSHIHQLSGKESNYDRNKSSFVFS